MTAKLQICDVKYVIENNLAAIICFKAGGMNFKTEHLMIMLLKCSVFGILQADKLFRWYEQ